MRKYTHWNDFPLLHIDHNKISIIIHTCSNKTACFESIQLYPIRMSDKSYMYAYGDVLVDSLVILNNHKEVNF